MGTEAMAERPRVLSPKERRQRNREEMIAAILDAARAVMREEGVAALNLQEVARRVGIRAPSLYEYFPSKMAIYDALFGMGIRLWAEHVNRVLQEYGPSWEGFRAAMENYLAWAQEYPELYYLCFERPVPGFVPSDESMQESLQLLATSVETMAAAIDAGLIAPGLPPAQATDLFIAMLHGLTASHMANEPHLPVGSGRFGSLIPAAVALFRAAWGTERSTLPIDTASPPGPAQSES